MREARESFTETPGSQRRASKASLTAACQGLLGCAAAMWTSSARFSLLAAALALGPSCSGAGNARVPLQLVTQRCAGAPPLEGATHLRLRVTGQDMEPLERLVP